MPHFALTRQGYDQLVKVCGGTPPSPLWVNASVLSPSELAIWRARGIDVTEFSRAVPLHGQGLADAIGTIQEHHPALSIWVEQAAQP